MNNIIWRGVSSTTIQGLLICELPPITKPEMRIAETVIDGRDGSIIEELGYSSYVKTVTIGLHGNFDINKVIKYFTGEGDIVFSNEPDKVYKAKICGKIDYTRLLRYRQASIPFLVQPFKYKLNEYLRETPTETISGTSIVVSKEVYANRKAFKIYGKSTQDGTPTLDAPIDIVSIGDDGGIAVSVNEQSVEVQTPNGLRGIPVSSGGNYTDANGQMWCADEIDLERGVYTQRIMKWVINGSKAPTTFVDGNKGGTVCGYMYANVMGGISTKRLPKMCNRLKSPPTTQPISYKDCEIGYWSFNSAEDEKIKDIFIVFNLGLFSTPAEVQAYLVEHPLIFIGILDTPIETTLTEEEIAQYNTLISNEPNITITNDENAYMMVEYFKPFEVFNEGLEDSKPLMILKGSGTVEISVNGTAIFSYTFPEGENEVYIDSETEDAYLGDVLKNRNMNGEFPILIPRTNKIEWSGDIESISILPRSRWL